MKKASEPNKEADYWDERYQINNNLESLAQVEGHCNNIRKNFSHKKEAVLNLESVIRKTNSTEAYQVEIQKYELLL